MANSISISITSELFQRLQSLAVPLVDDTSSVIEKLIDHWESNRPDGTTQKTSASTGARMEVWRSSRGDALPVGTALEAEYLKKTFRAKVEKGGIRLNGQIYDSPSAAGRAAKEQCGRKGAAASTDGRTFWKIQEPNTGRWIPLAALRPAQVIDVEAMLAELGTA